MAGAYGRQGGWQDAKAWPHGVYVGHGWVQWRMAGDPGSRMLISRIPDASILAFLGDVM
jgi:hypothetical protein